MKHISMHFFYKIFFKSLVKFFKATFKPKLKFNFANKKPNFVNIKPKLILVSIQIEVPTMIFSAAHRIAYF